MSTRMLIDARHPEETRVAVMNGNRIEEFDFESSEHKQLKGNIYLAKVTRVEPSLQAAFVDYGGNRHGFLAFSEIHPDYYQIPKADREALLAEEAEHAEEEQRLREAEEAEEEAENEEGGEAPDEAGTGSDASPVDESAVYEVRKKRQNLRRRYKIQDVIQRRQVLLVQVVKEERGNKGAALTTYLSLAGRYCVLMPNTSHGGGISRKISNGSDRKRLKQIMADLKLPKSMGLIVRTAGLSRTKTEIKRDFDYLARLWDEIREKTLKSAAPSLVYRDSDLVKRAIRDLYSREIQEVVVEGEEGYKAARRFMKLLMPSHVKRVKQYEHPTPIFQSYGIEDQLSGMYNPTVQLKSGGYLVINPTEALVSIDINSGRSTREHNIEQTAFQTNLEAAAEIARQLRLRDMAGLVVIDFIDMEKNSHGRKVEKAMKEALKSDRARIQVGRISSFGLMEMSRQRLRTGVLEASTTACPHCDGTGLMRTASSSGLSALRMIEDEAARGKGTVILLKAGNETAIFLLNKKRAELAEVEERYGVQVEVMIDDSFEGAKMSVESKGPRPPKGSLPPKLKIEDLTADIETDDEDEEEEETSEDEQPKKRKRRRRGGRGRRRRGGDQPQENGEESDEQAEERPADDDKPKRKTRRKKADNDADDAKADSSDDTADEGEEKPKTRRRPAARKKAADAEAKDAVSEEAKASKKRRTTRKKADEKPAEEEAEKKPAKRTRKKPEAKDSKADDAKASEVEEKPAKKPAAKKKAPAKKPAAKKAASTPAKSEKTEESANSNDSKESAEGDGPRRTGWWQRTFG
ncbi:Rne/Rng family ribonuclease [Sphingomicrobium marinum]|uniref:Rne/Rng family ribonuclease n=1 Tax=Sphingomicrobium marinum TaxID=1227950 RepID=UPI00223F5B40|nr:ribonuclease E/G [Sphingomicrobium marinum]